MHSSPDSVAVEIAVVLEIPFEADEYHAHDAVPPSLFVAPESKFSRRKSCVLRSAARLSPAYVPDVAANCLFNCSNAVLRSRFSYVLRMWLSSLLRLSLMSLVAESNRRMLNVKQFRVRRGCGSSQKLTFCQIIIRIASTVVGTVTISGRWVARKIEIIPCRTVSINTTGRASMRCLPQSQFRPTASRYFVIVRTKPTLATCRG